MLVVGGAGYIGSHTVRELLDAGIDTTVLDNLSAGHDWAVPEDILVKGDLGDEIFLDNLFSRQDFDAVMHFASFIQVGESVVNPLKYYSNNVGNTINLLQVMERHSIKKFVFSSTAAVYGCPDETPITEEARLGPLNPYGLSKLMVENILKDCERAWGLKSAILRYFNAAGAHISGKIGEAHEPETHLIPLLIQTALGKRDFITIYGSDYPTRDGTNVRDYIHVTDLALAHILALRALGDNKPSIVYNLGNGIGYSNLEVIEVVKRVTGVNFSVIFGDRRPGDPSTLVASSARIVRELGWNPKFNELETIVETAYKWHNRRMNCK